MAMIRCEQDKHFFNSDQQASCPYCRQGPILGGVIPDTRGVNDTRGTSHDGKTQRADQGGRTEQSRTDTRRAATAVDGMTRRVDRGTSAVSGFDPVVAWLVCIDGPSMGRDYRIVEGRNEVGRDPHNRVQITGDDTISRDGHCAVVFDPRGAVYWIEQGRGRNLVYINGKALRGESQDLVAYDRVEIGCTTLMFVPLCGDRFRWGGAQ
ncbi:MAG: hypothetical protein AMXMBFR64_25190 [Myxococcales bacterium]